MRLKLCTYLRCSKQNVMYDVRYSCISCIYMADLTSLFLFYFIFELLRIFAVMINTAKLELINAAENCLLKFFLVRTFFNNIQKLLIFFLIILCLSHSHLVKIKWFKYNLNKMLYMYWVMSGNWKLLINKTVQLEKKSVRLFRPMCFHGVSLMYDKWSRVKIGAWYMMVFW